MTGSAVGATIVDVVRAHAARLAAAGVASPHADALALSAHALELDPVTVRTAPLGAAAPQALARLDRLVAARERGVPLQHLTGSVGFRDLILECRPGVFVPRPETEVLAGLAIDAAGPAAVVVEPCTGTGAVALAVASEVAGARVIATDDDPAAVALAAGNARALGLEVDVRLGDLLEPVPGDLEGRVDVLVSNPPYLTPDEVEAAEREVRDHDPRGALVAGATGHEVSDRLIAAARAWLRPGGLLLLEVADVRASDTAQRARDAGLVEVVVTDDLTGRPRIVSGRNPRDARTVQR